MKKSFFYFLVLFLLFQSCKSDEEPPVGQQVATFQYDGENNTAPILEGGEHFMAARFPTSATTPYIGQTLDRIEFYLVNVPKELEILVYGESATGTPGDLLYAADLSGDLRANSWNGNLISTPIPITGEDLWITIRVFHERDNNSVGCDFGPARDNGDWILASTSNSWTTFRDFTGNASSINWNIRGFVD